MANEAIQVLRENPPIDWIVLDADKVEKGTLMMISGSSTIGRTAMSGSGLAPAFAGISHREKIESDGRKRLSLSRDGIWRIKYSGVVLAGQHVQISGINLVGAMDPQATFLSGSNVGLALEDGTDAQTKEVWVGK